MSKKRIRAYSYLLIVSIIWGIAGPIIKFTLSSFPPEVFLAYRFFLSMLVSILVLGYNHAHLPKKGSLVSLIFFVGFVTSTVRLGTLFLGFDNTTSISGTVISAISPMVMATAGMFFFHEHVTTQERLGMAIAFIGTIISVAEPAFASGGPTFTATLTGNMLVLISLFIDVISVTLTKYLLRKKISPLVISQYAFIVGFVTILPFAIRTHTPVQLLNVIAQAPLSAHLGVWYMAFISGSFAYMLNFRGLKSIEVGEAAVFSYLFPLWAAPLAFFWLGEKVSGVFVFGMVLIAIGVVIAEYKRRAG